MNIRLLDKLFQSNWPAVFLLLSWVNGLAV